MTAGYIETKLVEISWGWKDPLEVKRELDVLIESSSALGGKIGVKMVGSRVKGLDKKLVCKDTIILKLKVGQ